MNLRLSCVRILSVYFVLSVSSLGQVPQLINYQGRLVSGSNLVNGNVSLSLRLFNVPSGGLVKYEDSNSVTVADGLYSTFLGDNTTIGSLATALTNGTVFLETMVNGVALSPRERLAAAAYAAHSWGLSGNAGTIPGSHFIGTTDGQPLMIEASGGVGIGTPTPEGDLHVFRGSAGTVTASTAAPLVVESDTNEFIHMLSPTGTVSGILFGSPGSANDASIRYNNSGGNRELTFRTGGNSQKMVITSNGFVGIGTTSPDTLLHVSAGANGSATLTLESDTDNNDESDNPNILLNQDGGNNVSMLGLEGLAGSYAIDSLANATLLGSFSATPVQFIADAGAKMTIRENGFVGIGTNDPDVKLHVVGGSDVTESSGGYIVAGSIDGPNVAIDNNEIMARDNGEASVLYVNKNLANTFSDSVDIGGILTVDQVRPHADHTGLLGTSSRRWLEVWADNGVIQTSDGRFKENVQHLDSGLDTILKLRPVSFTWKNGKDGRRHLGLITQEVEPVVPEAVTKGDKPEDAAGMNYETFIPILIKAVQEQQVMIEGQRTTIESLQTTVSAQQSQLRELEMLQQKRSEH